MVSVERDKFLGKSIVYIEKDYLHALLERLGSLRIQIPNRLLINFLSQTMFFNKFVYFRLISFDS